MNYSQLLRTRIPEYGSGILVLFIYGKGVNLAFSAEKRLRNYSFKNLSATIFLKWIIYKFLRLAKTFTIHRNSI